MLIKRNIIKTLFKVHFIDNEFSNHKKAVSERRTTLYCAILQCKHTTLPHRLRNICGYISKHFKYQYA